MLYVITCEDHHICSADWNDWHMLTILWFQDINKLEAILKHDEENDFRKKHDFNSFMTSNSLLRGRWFESVIAMCAEETCFQDFEDISKRSFPYLQEIKFREYNTSHEETIVYFHKIHFQNMKITNEYIYNEAANVFSVSVYIYLYLI